MIGSRLQQGIVNLQTPALSESEVLLQRESHDADSLKRMIREMGLKVTTQRLEILHALTRGRAHRTAQEVFEVVHKVDPEIGFATVYRFLRDLAEAERVTEIRMGKNPTRYELKSKFHHDHLSCTICGKIIEFHQPDIEQLQELVARNHGFTLTGHNLELYGLCPECQ